MSILKLKDSQGNWISVPTLKGDKGNGIQSAVLNNDYTLTLTFTDGTTYTTPSIRGEKGEQGEPATDMDIHICSASEYDSETRIPTIANPNDKTFYLVPTEDGTSPDLFTEWVYINNAWEMFGSMKIDLSGYVKDTDYATGVKAGVIKLNPNYGINVTDDGILYVNTAESKNAKMGTNNARPITPIIQHESIFYGLAKASGHDEKDSTLPVGQYTDEAKSAIQDMLDVPSTSELKEVNDSKADVIVESASGDIVSFDDGADNMPLKSLVVDINPVQDLNGYDSPWVGGGGKNLLDSSLLKDQEAWNIIPIKVKPNTAYTASTDKPSLSAMPAYFTINNTGGGGGSNNLYVNHSVTITSTEDGYVYFSQRRASGEDSFANYHFQVEEGSTATDWTPYENICPINGWNGMQLAQTGKNLWNGTLINGDVDIDVKVGITYTISAIASSNTYLYLRRRPIGTSDYTRVRYVLAGATNGSATFVPEEGYIYSLWSNATYTAIEDVQIEVDSTPTSYEPYNGTTISINWQTEAGTVYGGSLDVLTGILTITMALMNLGAHSNWTYDNTSFAYGFFTANGITTKANGSSNIVCTQYKTIHGGRSALTSNATICPYNTSNSNSVCIRDDAYTDVAEFKSAMDGVQMAYELKTPIEIQLTPTEVRSLLGTNNIWADTGATSIEYCADTEMYIEKVKPIVNVDDVQINGTSIVNDGVANVPLASSDNYGVVKIGNGVTIVNVGTNKLLSVNRATDAQVKDGTQIYRPITPVVQDSSTFYGLAKAAGADEKDSTLAFGTYSDNAKSSIQNMLGITDKYSPKEWMAESETELVTNAHSKGDLFYIGETLYKVIADLNAGDAVNVGVNVEEVNANDILDDYATKEDVQDNVSIVEKSASGAIASFPDGADDIPLKSLVVDINPVQDLHGYDSPWVGGGRKNKWNGKLSQNPYTHSGVTYTQADDGTIVGSGTATALSYTNLMTFAISDAGDYIASSSLVGGSGATYYLRVYKNGDALGNVFGSSDSFVIDGLVAGDVIGFRCYVTNGTSANGVVWKPMLRLSSVTDPTYSPYENICPISGWTGVNVTRCGKNVFDASTFFAANGGTLQPDGSYYIDNPNTIYNKVFWSNPNTYEGQLAITFIRKTEASKTSTRLVVKYTDGTSQKVGNMAGTGSFDTYTFITASDKVVSEIVGDYGSSYPSYVYVQIEVGTTATPYSPYTGRSITIDLGQTVYGAHVDVLSGVMRVTHGIVDMGTLNPTMFTTAVGNLFRMPISGMSGEYSPSIPSEIYCSAYKTASYTTRAVNTIYQYSTGVDVIDNNYDNASDFKDAMSGVQVVYPLATPIKVQLDAHAVNSLLGVNNIFADTGNTSVEYFSQVDKDLIDYIETSLKPYAKEERLNDYVSDVQVNGNSIVENNVANVPIATQNVIGALYTASEADGKVGTHTYRAIVPKVQHSSVFYGLAKAAGDITQSSSTNAIGTYTEEAKTAIKQMLGVHDTIDSFVEEVTGTDVTITGQPSYRYNCGELYSLTVTPPSSGTIDIRFTSGSTPTVLTLPQTVKMPEWWVEVEANTIYEMCITDGIYCGVMTWAI